MRKVLTYYIFLTFIFAFGQNLEEEEFAIRILKEKNKNYNFVIINDLDTFFPEHTTRSLKSNQNIFQDRYNKNEITLTDLEKDYLVKSLENQYKSTWNKSTLGGIKVLNTKKAKRHSAKNINNGYIFISKPIFIRDNKIALSYFGYVVGQVKANKRFHGYFELYLYKLNSENQWEKWIMIERSHYN